MPSEPLWTPHHVITVNGARRAIRSQFPDVAADDLEHLGGGWEFDAYRTGDGWVFRFPRRREAPAQMRAELAYLDLVRPALAPDVAVPLPELFGEPGPDCPFPFTGYRLIAGVGADHRDVPVHPELARQIGAALTRIHTIPIDAAERVGVRRETETCRDWRDEALPLVPALEGIDPAVDAAVAWLVADPPVPAPYRGPGRLLHNDLCPDHVIVNPETGELVGLIDWTDTSVGDPTLDFTFLVTWRGWGFANAVLAHYAAPVDSGFRQRLGYQTRAFSLIWLAEAIVRAADVSKHVRWVAHAFAD